ncbi:MAG: reverse transcriptase family protein [Gemmataceae bacterium]
MFTLWRNINQAGGIDAYVDVQLRERGFLVERRETDGMSERELSTYKKQLKAEAEERRRLRKDAWRAYKANHIVFLGDGIHWTDNGEHDKWDLPDAEERAAENELPALDTPLQLAEALSLSISELRWLSFHREAATRIHYRRFTIPKRNGTPRPIWAPMKKLKAAQRWINRNIVERLVVHGAAHGFLPGRSILTNAEHHTDARIVLKMDIEGFFPTVTLPRVRGVFRKAGYRERVATLLALLCTESPREVVHLDGKEYYVALGPRCLPQGAPTSPGLTNALCLKLDQRLDGLAKKYGWRYTRYADDLTFSLPTSHADKPHLGTLLGLVERIVKAEGFRIQREKTRVSRKGGRQKVTGLVVNGAAPPRVPRKLRRQLRAAVHNLKQGKPLHEGETLHTLVGYTAYIEMCHPELGRKLREGLPPG